MIVLSCTHFRLEYKVKQSKNGKFPSHCKLAQSIWKCKGPLKNVSPGAYFWNFTVFHVNDTETWPRLNTVFIF